MRPGAIESSRGRVEVEGQGGRGFAGLVTPAILGVVSGSILVPLNSTMLAVALPSVATAYAVGPNEVASLVTLYLGAVAVTLPASGSIGDRFGPRRSFLAGVIGFAGASLLAAVAPSFGVLAITRVLQAASGSLVSTSSVALIRRLAPADRRGTAFGVFDMLVSTSAAIGPLIGGLIVGAFDWRAMFLLAVPIAAVAAIAVGLRPDAGPAAGPGAAPRPASRPIDLPGLMVLAIFLIALLIALRGGSVAALAGTAAAIALVALVSIELRSAHPAVDPRLFTSRTFAAAVVGVLGSTVVLHATLVMVPLLVERLREGTPETSGLVLLGISALGAIAAPVGGRWSDRAGRRTPVVAGSLVMAAGLGVLWQVAAGASPLVLGLLLAVVGLGMGFTSPRQPAALETVGPERTGMAAGTYYTGRYLGGVLGASLAGAVLGGGVTASGVMTGFGALALVGILVTVASLGLPGRPEAGRRRT